MSEVDETRRRIRRLLLSGDNTLKVREGPERVARARARYEEALALADDAGVDEGIRELVRGRLAALPAGGGPDAP